MKVFYPPSNTEFCYTINPANFAYKVHANAPGTYRTPLPTGTPVGSSALGARFDVNVPVSHTFGGGNHTALYLSNCYISGNEVVWVISRHNADSGSYGGIGLGLFIKRGI